MMPVTYSRRCTWRIDSAFIFDLTSKLANSEVLQYFTYNYYRITFIQLKFILNYSRNLSSKTHSFGSGYPPYKSVHYVAARCVSSIVYLAMSFSWITARTKISFRLYLLSDDGYGFVNRLGTSRRRPSYNFKDLKADLSQQVMALVERGKRCAPVDRHRYAEILCLNISKLILRFSFTMPSLSAVSLSLSLSLLFGILREIFFLDRHCLLEIKACRIPIMVQWIKWCKHRNVSSKKYSCFIEKSSRVLLEQTKKILEFLEKMLNFEIRTRKKR